MWDTNTGELLRELRRGADRAEIYSLSFTPTSSFLACSSDKGTIHIFSLTGNLTASTDNNNNNSNNNNNNNNNTPLVTGPRPDDNQLASNKSLNLGLLRGFLPSRLVPKYFDSEWSYAQIHGIDGKSICAFSRDSTKIHVMSSEGIFITCSYLDGGEGVRLSSYKVELNEENNDENDIGVGSSRVGNYEPLEGQTE